MNSLRKGAMLANAKQMQRKFASSKNISLFLILGEATNFLLFFKILLFKIVQF